MVHTEKHEVGYSSPHDNPFADPRSARLPEKFEVTDSKSGPTPYLGIQARLSQIWFNRWTVLLLLVLVRVLLLLGGLNGDLTNAKAKALSACSKVEDVGSAMASMPHYLSVGVNELAAMGITKAVHGMMETLNLILTGVEELILFVINMMTSTYTCLITAAIHGGLNVTAVVVQDATKEINSVIPGIADDIQTLTDGVNSAIKSAFSAIDSAASFVHIDMPPQPSIDASSDVDKLKNYKIDSSGFVSDLVKLNQDIPTFDEVQNYTRQAVSFPFDLVKKALNQSYGDWQFDKSVFPVAQKEALSFCSNNSSLEQFFENLFKLAADAKIAFIVIISTLAVLACGAMAYLEIYRWRSQKRYITIFYDQAIDKRDLMNMSSRPLTSKWALKLANKLFGRNERRKLLVRWAVAYGTSLPAIFVLSLAIAGLFSCFCQFVILRTVESKVPELENQVGDFAGQVVTSLEKVSVDWANDINGVIGGLNDDINTDVLVYVRNSTQAVNDTLNTFVDHMQKGLADVFKGTVLMDPIEEVVHCLIGLKIEAVEKGLTWVHDHAEVSFPLLPNDTFSQGARESVSGDSDLTSFLNSPGSVSSDEVSGAVTHVTDYYRGNIIQEAIISTALLLVYVLVVLIGIVRMLVSAAVPERYASSGGRSSVSKEDGEVPLEDMRATRVNTSAPRIPSDFAQRSTGGEILIGIDEICSSGRIQGLAY